MKPVAIFRHARSEGPGYFATYLERRSIPWHLVAVDQGERLPRDARRFSGLARMGGPMSVNDEALPWIAPLLELVRDAVRKDLPVLGHCLGGQLMAKAFGGAGRASPGKEVGGGGGAAPGGPAPARACGGPGRSSATSRRDSRRCTGSRTGSTIAGARGWRAA